MSLTVFTAGAQFGAVALLQAGAATPVILLSTALPCALFLFLGLSLGRRVALSLRQRLAAAYFLTEAAYAVTIARGKATFAFLLGAELSMFATWNLCTWVGLNVGQRIPPAMGDNLSVVAPLAFAAMLAPQLRGRAELLAAATAGLVAALAARLWPGGPTLVLASLCGSAVGVWWSCRAPGRACENQAR